MKVYNLTSDKTEEYEDSYAARLIEQGKAILPHASASARSGPPTARANPADSSAELVAPAESGSGATADKKPEPNSEAGKADEAPKATAKTGKVSSKYK